MLIDKIKGLKDIIVNKENDEDVKTILNFIDKRVENICNYVTAVENHVTTIQTANSLNAGGRIDRDNYLARIKDADERRKFAHDSAMAAMAQLNRLCDKYEIEHICPEEETDRYDKGNYAGILSTELFLAGRNVDQEIIRNTIEELLKSSKNRDNLDFIIETRNKIVVEVIDRSEYEARNTR